MSNRLFVDEIISVGAVSEGDNPDAEITFWKKRTETITDIEPGDTTTTISDKESRPTVTKKGARMAEFDFEGFTDEQRTAIESQFTVYEETISGFETPEVEEDVTKTAAPEIQELIAKQAQELDEARAEIAKERKVRRDTEYLAKAKELEPVLGDPVEWGPVLDQIQDAAPEAYEKLSARLVAAKAQIETGDLFKELGRAGDGEPDKLAALTKARMELHPELTVEQARAAIWRENPELVQEARSL